MTFYVLLYDTYCITVPTTWADFEQCTFQMPKKSKQLTQACMKKWSPCADWDEFTYHKSFGTYQNARLVEKAISDMSASDDNIILQTRTENALKKRLIKKRKFYGDTSSSEDEPKKSKITMPSNYIPSIESGYVSNSLSEPINKLPTITNHQSACESTTLNNKPSNTFDQIFDSCLDVSIQDKLSDSSDFYDKDSYHKEQYCNTEMQNTMTHDNHEQKKKLQKKCRKQLKM
ncbi:uncharacterized protein LOC109503943 isoform X3 [Harpegnathos saltator]|uniref:uncharacterized protein LOC109503943 isoform X3 n=1 Tax=Harpegnathos saltator TaxID=610380 RepID=UPI000DBEE0B3|nr:uncharacterized protein LOC109503943 isoform X3 [Harpegnathos saltator]